MVYLVLNCEVGLDKKAQFNPVMLGFREGSKLSNYTLTYLSYVFPLLAFIHI